LQLLGGGLQVGFPSRHDGQVGSVRQQSFGDAETYALAAAGHHGPLSG
jgi:hypothetical protein